MFCCRAACGCLEVLEFDLGMVCHINWPWVTE
ncbi:hypothetical protein HALLA_20310 (plasmid) [Halostagnicola larsenii XH-48]|uniref:Uncharacterized protein n=1 Tax=Halostagnicola larsenii XH-48 TaxID=797299 RepID=W0JYA0_9EURY|nr:hypothetical protein HALLA_20310 [Halostagnicola larsenii XH-48]